MTTYAPTTVTRTITISSPIDLTTILILASIFGGLIFVGGMIKD